MKYRIGKVNEMPVYTDTKSLNAGKFLWTEKNIITENGTAKTAITKKAAGYLSSSLCPFLLRKTFSSVYLTLIGFVSKYGVKDSDNINASKDKIGIKCAKKSAIDMLDTIPIQNIRFQKLSLFSRSLIQFTRSTAYNSYRPIVSLLKKKLKLNIKLLVVITAALFASVVNAGEIESLIGKVEKEYDIPKDLLLSIALVESKVNPYTLNVDGKAVLAKSKGEIKSKLQSYLKNGISSIDIGVMQINYRWHRKKFGSLDEMLDPQSNIEYAAKYLCGLYDIHGSWIKAVRHYHSANPEYHRKYSRKIIVTWLNS